MHLFETRARERGIDFQITEENREDVNAIVEKLDGMPLAVELAAARIGMMQPRQIRERLSDRFKLLGGVKGPNKRQQTLRTTIDWSWDLLEEWEDRHWLSVRFLKAVSLWRQQRQLSTCLHFKKHL